MGVALGIWFRQKLKNWIEREPEPETAAEPSAPLQTSTGRHAVCGISRLSHFLRHDIFFGLGSSALWDRDMQVRPVCS